jgi:hypothetical protein
MTTRIELIEDRTIGLLHIELPEVLTCGISSLES